LIQKRADDAKFRRNHQLGDHICDFYCHETKLVVECDGDAHNTPERRELDRKRDVYLRSQGLTVLRFENSRVLKATDSVLEEIANQFTVIEAGHSRRPDLVVFVNGLPLALIELKNAADEDATIWSAYAQLQTYKAEVPSLLHYKAALVVSDGLQARMGSLTANQEWFKVWRTIDGEGGAPKTALELEVLVRGVFDRQRFLDLLQHFIVFEEDADTGALHKIIAGYHQFHAVNAAVEETVRASGSGTAGGARPSLSWTAGKEAPVSIPSPGWSAAPKRLGRAARRPRPLLGGPDARRKARRPSRGRGLAHAA